MAQPLSKIQDEIKSKQKNKIVYDVSRDYYHKTSKESKHISEMSAKKVRMTYTPTIQFTPIKYAKKAYLPMRYIHVVSFKTTKSKSKGQREHMTIVTDRILSKEEIKEQAEDFLKVDQMKHYEDKGKMIAGSFEYNVSYFNPDVALNSF